MAEHEADLEQSFKEAAKPLIEWLCNHGHPHMKVLVEPTGAELVEGKRSVSTTEFLVD